MLLACSPTWFMNICECSGNEMRRNDNEIRRTECGAALVEFALIALILYVILSVTIEFGRILYGAQVLQDVSRLAARELAVTAMPANMTFDCALGRDPGCENDYSPVTSSQILDIQADVKARIWDDAKLVVDAGGSNSAVDAAFANLPLVNRALRPLLIYDDFTCTTRKFFRYPGHVQVVGSSDPCDWNGSTVTFKITVPVVISGGATLAYLDVLGEVRNPTDVSSGPFHLTMTGDGRPEPKGVAAVVTRYPFQAASMSGFTPQAQWEPTIGGPIEADGATPVGTYTGPDGLGAQYAMAKKVRPYRRILTGQAFFRREVME